MRFMYIVTSPQPDKGPTPALMEAMGKLADREIKAGRMLDSGGLMPVAMAGAQVRITDGKLGVIDGPFVETKELIGGYAIFQLRDMEEAVAAVLGEDIGGVGGSKILPADGAAVPEGPPHQRVVQGEGAQIAVLAGVDRHVARHAGAGAVADEEKVAVALLGFFGERDPAVVAFDWRKQRAAAV